MSYAVAEHRDAQGALLFISILPLLYSLIHMTVCVCCGRAKTGTEVCEEKFSLCCCMRKDPEGR